MRLSPLFASISCFIFTQTVAGSFIDIPVAPKVGASIQEKAKETEAHLKEIQELKSLEPATFATFPRSPVRVEIPVFFHIISKKDGTGFSDGKWPMAQRIKMQIEQLNRSFSAGEIAKNRKDARLTFILKGVQYIEDDNQFEQCAPNIIMKGRSITTDRILNIFTCNLPMVIGAAAKKR